MTSPIQYVMYTVLLLTLNGKFSMTGYSYLKLGHFMDRYCERYFNFCWLRKQRTANTHKHWGSNSKPPNLAPIITLLISCYRIIFHEPFH